jgi:hypothetical protein
MYAVSDQKRLWDLVFRGRQLIGVRHGPVERDSEVVGKRVVVHRGVRVVAILDVPVEGRAIEVVVTPFADVVE